MKWQQMTLIAWMEANHLADVDHCIEGLREWAKITNTAIVSTVPGLAGELYLTLPHAATRVGRIIPGLKTHPILGDDGWDNKERWAEVWREVGEIVAVTGSETVVFEHESAVKSVLAGPPWDPAKFRECLEQSDLSKNLRILWRPLITSSFGETGQLIGLEIGLIVKQACPNVVLIDGTSVTSPWATTAGITQRGSRLLRALASPDDPWPIAYFYGPEKSYWQDEQIIHSTPNQPAVLDLVQGKILILYPGKARWVEAAKAIVGVLTSDA